MHLFLSHLCCVPSVKCRDPCMCRLLELMTDISYLHMTASCQSLPSYLHMTASCQSLTSHLHTVASCSSFYLCTWLPHNSNFSSSTFIPSHLYMAASCSWFPISTRLLACSSLFTSTACCMSISFLFHVDAACLSLPPFTWLPQFQVSTIP